MYILNLLPVKENFLLIAPSKYSSVKCSSLVNLISKDKKKKVYNFILKNVWNLKNSTLSPNLERIEFWLFSTLQLLVNIKA